MNDPGAGDAPDSRKVFDAVEEGVHEGAGSDSGPGVDHEARGLVDHEEEGVLMDYGQGNRLGCRLRLRDLRDQDLDPLPGANARRGSDRLALEEDVTLLDQGLYPGPAEIREARGEVAIDPLAPRRLLDREAEETSVLRRQRLARRAGRSSSSGR
jgi:hypothetical protein